MDLLTSSFNSDPGSATNLSSDNNQPVYANEEKIAFPEDMIDFQCSLAGRESFAVEGRDSLGILQNFNNILDVPKLTFDTVHEHDVSFANFNVDGRESIGILRNSFIHDGRESLGILRNSFLEDGRNSLGFFRNSLDVAASVSSNLLNVGFVKLSATSSVSSTDSAFRPSLWSLDYDSEELSKIFSSTYSKNTISLNTAFVDSNKKDEEFENSGTIAKKSGSNIEVKEAEEVTGSMGLQNNIELNDTVFLESKIIAAEIENGTIFNDSPDDLFSTNLPELIDISFDEPLDLPNKNNIDINMKSADQLCSREISETGVENEDIEVKTKPIEENLQELKVGNQVVLSREMPNEIDTQDNFLKVTQAGDKLNTSFSPKLSNNVSRNSSNSRSRDPKDLIHNLSTIINTENLDNQSEVKQILQDLADVLLVPNSKEKNDDSGHSSIEENDVDSSLKYCSEENIQVKLDRSDNQPGTRLSQSCCFAKSAPKIAEQSLDNIQQRTRLRSLDKFDGLKNTNVKKLSLPNLKLNPKKNAIETVKKGPLKAVLPLSNMKRRSYTQLKKVETPSKNSSFEKSYLKKRTSTPKTWNAVPVAQSTPEQLNESELSKSFKYSGGKKTLPFSPQLSKSSLNNSSNKHVLLNRSSSASAPNISRDISPSQIPSISNLVAAPSKFISRRRSISEIQYETKTTKNLGNKFAKSPLARYNTPGANVAGGSADLRTDNENARAQKRDRYSLVSTGEDRMKRLNKTDSKTVGIETYLSARNRNLMQYIKPLNLLDKMKK